MQKWLVFILLLITVAGTVIPCCGSDECCTEQAGSASDHTGNKAEGACSPFFACATCPGFVVMTEPVQLITPLAEKTTHYQSIVCNDLSAYATSFWQPPRSC